MNSQQLAEELARKCAKTLNYGDADPCDCPECKKYLEKQSELVLKSIPLVELVECLDSYKSMVQSDEECVSNAQIANMISKEFHEAHSIRLQQLKNLTTKLKQLGIDL